MMIEQFCPDDITPFLKLAAAEGWVAEPWEFEFLLAEFSEGCFTARADGGETCGFVTSLRHDSSGWVGNLIVAPAYRGKGVGGALFRRAMAALAKAGAETIWLTASKAGMPLYQKQGFKRIDTVIRWSGSGRGRQAADDAVAAGEGEELLLDDIDSQGWGDRRSSLLAVIADRGRLLRQDLGLVVVQSCGEDSQLGPFSAPGYGTAATLLKDALCTIPYGTKVCLDAPASNRSAAQLFSRNKMSITGSNELMYAGVKPAYQPQYIYALATMGSCG